MPTSVEITPDISATIARKLIQELSTDLVKARALGDWQQIHTIEAQILFLSVLAVYGRTARQPIEDGLQRMKLIIFEGGENVSERMGQAFRDMFRDIAATVAATLDQAATDLWGRAKENFFGAASSGLLHGASGVPVNSEGNPAPKPGQGIFDIEDEDADLTTILLVAAPLLYLIGDRTLRPRLENQAFQAPPVASNLVERSLVGVSAPWRNKLAVISARLNHRGLVAGTVARLQANGPEDAFQELSSHLLGSPGRRGYADAVETVVSTEAHRIRSEIDEIRRDNISEVEVGFMLRSSFLPTTSEAHAARDGWRFYEDNRPEASASWEARHEYTPPYEYPHCKCYTVPIYEIPDDLDGADSRLGIEEAPDVAARSLGSYDAWFSAQRPGVQRRLVGDRRWFAVAAHGFGIPAYADFVDSKGRILSANKLARESFQQFRSRSNDALAAIRRRDSRNKLAWESGQLTLTPREEAEYKRRLRAYLRRSK